MVEPFRNRQSDRNAISKFVDSELITTCPMPVSGQKIHIQGGQMEHFTMQPVVRYKCHLTHAGRVIRSVLAVFLVLLIPSTIFSATDLVVIRESSGTAQANYPVQFGRVFVKGEIANYPRALVNGVAVTTQADVKSRWSDGSVKHAVLSFLLPSLAANSSANITFSNQSSGNNTALTSSAMLAPGFNFDAVIRLAGPSTVSASARAMLNAGKYMLWTQGSVATTVIIADHSAARAYDMGFDANRAFRPIFHATFWPGINKVRVRYIGEISNTQALHNQTYNLTLTAGSASPATVYTQNSVVHAWATRWTREAWIGGAPGAVAINHNTAYCVESGLLPFYDLSKTVSEATIASTYANWQSKNRALFGQALWTSVAMGAVGGRPEIGPMTAWTTQYVYTWDRRMQEIAFGMADFTGNWPMHFREGVDTKNYLRTSTTEKAIGKPVSITNRQTLMFGDGNNYLKYNYTLADHRITPISASASAYIPDCSHQPDLQIVPYALSGDYWYLEQAYFWASWSAAQNNGAAYNLPYGRGPTGAEGGVSDQLRGQAWKLRSRAETAFLAPDGSPEKLYFTQLLEDGLAILEGSHNITGSAYQGNACWSWGKTYQYSAANLPPLGQWIRGSAEFAQTEYGINKSVTAEAMSNFEQHYFLYSIGRVKELGYPAGKLVSWMAPCYVAQLTSAGYNPYLISNGRMPTVKVGGQYFTSWAELKTGYDATWQNRTSFSIGAGPESYCFLGLAATSMIARESGGANAWAFMRDKALTQSVLNNDPRWALMPRTAVVTPPPPPPTSGAPVITAQPVSQSVTAGASITFTVSATGTPAPTYQWRRNGVNISGATSASYSLTNVQTANAGTYQVAVSNSAGSVVSIGAVLTVNGVTPPPPTNGAPVIASHPVSKSANPGSTVTFTVAATGNPGPYYQWRKNGVDIWNNGTTIAGVQTSTLTLTNVQGSAAGNYQVYVYNSAGNVVSRSAVLTVGGVTPPPPTNGAPVITSQPVSRTANSDGTVTFTVAATGNPAPYYQWRKNGVDLWNNGTTIAGVQTPTLTLTNVQSDAAGNYQVYAYNSVGGVMSADAVLTVGATQSMDLEPMVAPSGSG